MDLTEMTPTQEQSIRERFRKDGRLDLENKFQLFMAAQRAANGKLAEKKPEEMTDVERAVVNLQQGTMGQEEFSKPSMGEKTAAVGANAQIGLVKAGMAVGNSLADAGLWAVERGPLAPVVPLLEEQKNRKMAEAQGVVSAVEQDVNRGESISPTAAAFSQGAGGLVGALPAYAAVGAAVPQVAAGTIGAMIHSAATFGLGNALFAPEGQRLQSAAEGAVMGGVLGGVTSRVANPFIRRPLGSAIMAAPSTADMAMNGPTPENIAGTTIGAGLGFHGASYRPPIRFNPELGSYTIDPAILKQARTKEGYKATTGSGEVELHVGALNVFMQTAVGKKLANLWSWGRKTVAPQTVEEMKAATDEGLVPHPEMPEIMVSKETSNEPPKKPVPFVMEDIVSGMKAVQAREDGAALLEPLQKDLVDLQALVAGGEVPEALAPKMQEIDVKLMDLALTGERRAAGWVAEKIYSLKENLKISQVETIAERAAMVEQDPGLSPEAKTAELGKLQKELRKAKAVKVSAEETEAPKTENPFEPMTMKTEAQDLMDRISYLESVSGGSQEMKLYVESLKRDLADLMGERPLEATKPEAPKTPFQKAEPVSKSVSSVASDPTTEDLINMTSEELDSFILESRESNPFIAGQQKAKAQAQKFLEWRNKAAEEKPVDMSRPPEGQDFDRIIYGLMGQGKDPLVEGPSWQSKETAFKYQKRAREILKENGQAITLTAGLPSFEMVWKANKTVGSGIEKLQGLVHSALRKSTNWMGKDAQAWFGMDIVPPGEVKAIVEEFKRLEGKYTAAGRRFEKMLDEAKIKGDDKELLMRKFVTHDLDPETMQRLEDRIPGFEKLIMEFAREDTIERMNANFPYDPRNREPGKYYFPRIYDDVQKPNEMTIGGRHYYATGNVDSARQSVTRDFIVTDGKGKILSYRAYDPVTGKKPMRKAAFKSLEEAQKFQLEHGLVKNFVKRSQRTDSELFGNRRKARAFIEKALEEYPELLQPNSLNGKNADFGEKLLRLGELAKEVDDGVSVEQVMKRLPRMINNSRHASGTMLKEPASWELLKSIGLSMEMKRYIHRIVKDRKTLAQMGLYTNLLEAKSVDGNPVYVDKPTEGYSSVSDIGLGIPEHLKSSEALNRFANGYVQDDVAMFLRVMYGSKRAKTQGLASIPEKLAGGLWKGYRGAVGLNKAALTVLNPFRYPLQAAENEVTLAVFHPEKFVNFSRGKAALDFIQWCRGKLPDGQAKQIFDEAFHLGVGGDSRKSTEALFHFMKKDVESLDSTSMEYQKLEADMFKASKSRFDKLVAMGVAAKDATVAAYGWHDMLTKYYSYAFDRGLYRDPWYKSLAIKSPEEAHRVTQDMFFDFDATPEAVKFASQFALFYPSVAWNFGKIALNSAKANPVKFAASLALWNGLNALIQEHLRKKNPAVAELVDAMDRPQDGRFKYYTGDKIGGLDVSFDMSGLFTMIDDRPIQWLDNPAQVPFLNTMAFPIQGAVGLLSAKDRYGRDLMPQYPTRTEAVAAGIEAMTSYAPMLGGFYELGSAKKSASIGKPWWYPLARSAGKLRLEDLDEAYMKTLSWKGKAARAQTNRAFQREQDRLNAEAMEE